MTVVILCGGKGSRLVEMTDVLPKPMIPVGGKPLLQHIIDIYKSQVSRNFVLPVGYKKEYILAYLLSLRPDEMKLVGDGANRFTYRDWVVTTVDTGEETQTGGRLKRVQQYVGKVPFHFTYGDGLSDVSLRNVQKINLDNSPVATITLVHPEGRFGRAVVEEDTGMIMEFGEKAETLDWINGGFSILHPDIFHYIENDMTNLERDVYPELVRAGLMYGYKHTGFWKCVDTKRDLLELDSLYSSKGAVWLPSKA